MEVASSGENPRPHGNPVPQSVVRARLDIVRDLACRFASTSTICRIAKRDHQLPYRTTQRYLRRVRLLWEAEAVRDGPRLKEHHRRTLEAIADEARQGGRYSASVTARRLLAEIDGVRAPEKHEVAVSTDAVDVEAMTAPEFEEYSDLMDRMRTLRAAARARKA